MGMLPGSVHYDLATGLCDADVVMCLRLQRERMDEGLISSIGEYSKLYQVNRKSLRAAAPDCIVMHPGPMNRGVELDDEVADFDRSAILSQVENCIFARMAALYWCFGGQIRPPEATTKARSGKK